MAALGSGRSANAESFAGSTNDARILIAFQADEAAVQAMLSVGWQSVPFPGGALDGANMLLVLVDRYLARDAEGNPSDPASFRTTALVCLAKGEGSEEERTYATAERYDPYGNGAAAEIRRSATLESADRTAPNRTEEWSVEPESGGELAFTLRYQSGTPPWSSSEGMPCSSTAPDVHRIDRYEQLVDVAMSGPLGMVLDGDKSLGSSVEGLGGLFGGSEKVVAAMAIPMSVREVFLPRRGGGRVRSRAGPRGTRSG
ncbi:hypothetical protein OEZ60_19535 [Defluviimonas sp. WL0024]|uniref:Uncharacterized protein n=1 Tax=Albidovulum salinarum TaxID=2984153 RepID=A0ABT2X8A2_9RHOB|nr:hypothetical protein [Defluviimonas sp. WL0024]MCU9850185.1 hypothetical protein [Defluviimonas sp. WL0024]